MPLLLLLLIAAPVFALDSITFAGLCVGPMRIERSRADPTVVEVYCASRAAEPQLRLARCPAPAQIETAAQRKTIRCPGQPPVVVIQK